MADRRPRRARVPRSLRASRARHRIRDRIRSGRHAGNVLPATSRDPSENSGPPRFRRVLPCRRNRARSTRNRTTSERRPPARTIDPTRSLQSELPCNQSKRLPLRNRGCSATPRGSRHFAITPRNRVRRIESPRTTRARHRSSGFAIAIELVTSRAHPDPGRQFIGDRSVVRALADIAELARDRLPFRSVRSPHPCDRVGDLVKEHLVNLIVVEPDGEVFRHRDPLVVIVTEPGAGFRRIEPEGPYRGIEMQRDERIRPPPNSHQVSHPMTITHLADVSGKVRSRVRARGRNPRAQPRRRASRTNSQLRPTSAAPEPDAAFESSSC